MVNMWDKLAVKISPEKYEDICNKGHAIKARMNRVSNIGTTYESDKNFASMVFTKAEIKQNILESDTKDARRDKIIKLIETWIDKNSGKCKAYLDSSGKDSFKPYQTTYRKDINKSLESLTGGKKRNLKLPVKAKIKK